MNFWKSGLSWDIPEFSLSTARTEWPYMYQPPLKFPINQAYVLFHKWGYIASKAGLSVVRASCTCYFRAAMSRLLLFLSPPQLGGIRHAPQQKSACQVNCQTATVGQVFDGVPVFLWEAWKSWLHCQPRLSASPSVVAIHFCNAEKNNNKQTNRGTVSRKR